MKAIAIIIRVTRSNAETEEEQQNKYTQIDRYRHMFLQTYKIIKYIYIGKMHIYNIIPDETMIIQ